MLFLSLAMGLKFEKRKMDDEWDSIRFCLVTVEKKAFLSPKIFLPIF